MLSLASDVTSRRTTPSMHAADYQSTRRAPRAPRPFLAHLFGLGLRGLALRRFLRACTRPVRPCVRINESKARPQLEEILAEEGLRLNPVPWSACGFFVELTKQSVAIGQLDAHVAGEIYGQEPSSMLPGEVVRALYCHRISEGSTGCISSSRFLVLDLCAAPGSKTTHISTSIGAGDLIIANESDETRMKLLQANLLRAGVPNFLVVHQDGRKVGNLAPGMFDVVLVDAPCSAEGNIRKAPDAFRRWGASGHAKQNENLIALQWDLIQSGWLALKPGGHLVYSTCTLNSMENEEQCQRLLQENRDAQKVDLGSLLDLQSIADHGYLRVWPHEFDTEGFFVSCFHKCHHVLNRGAPSTSSQEMMESDFMRKMDLRQLTASETKPIRQQAETEYGWWPDTENVCAEDTNGKIWLLPNLPASLRPLACCATRPSVQVATLRSSSTFSLSSELLLLAGHRASMHSSRVDTAQTWIDAYAQAGGGVGALSMQMDNLAEAGDAEGVRLLIREMRHSVLHPDVVSYNILLKALARSKDAFGAEQVLSEMKGIAVQPNEVSFSTAMDAHARSGDVAGIERLIVQMQQESLNPQRLTSTLVRAYIASGQVDSAELVLLEQSKSQPCPVACTLLLDALAKSADAVRATRVLATAIERQLQPNVINYSTLIAAHAQRGDADKAEAVLHDMCRQRLEPSIVSYTSLIKARARMYDGTGAEHLLQELRAKGMQPTLITYTAVLGAYASTGDYAAARQIIQDIRQSCCKLDAVCYNMWAKAHLRGRDILGGIEVLKEMQTDRLDPASISFGRSLISKAGK